MGRYGGHFLLQGGDFQRFTGVVGTGPKSYAMKIALRMDKEDAVKGNGFITHGMAERTTARRRNTGRIEFCGNPRCGNVTRGMSKAHCSTDHY